MLNSRIHADHQGSKLDVSGFDLNISIQLPSTETILGLILAIGSIIAFALTLHAYSRYNLSYKDIKEVRLKLKEKQND